MSTALIQFDIPRFCRYCGGPLSCDCETRKALTMREVEIIGALARGLSNAAIGRELGIAYDTVKKHYLNAAIKLGVRNRVQLVAVYLEEKHRRELSIALTPSATP